MRWCAKANGTSWPGKCPNVAHLFAAVGRHDEIVGAIERRFGGLVDSLTLRGDGVGEVPPGLVQDIRRVPHRYAGLPKS